MLNRTRKAFTLLDAAIVAVVLGILALVAYVATTYANIGACT